MAAAVFCAGSGQCGRDVLCSTDAVYDRVIDSLPDLQPEWESRRKDFHVTDIPALTVETGLKMGVIALGCAFVSIMFCIALNGAAGLYGRWFKNKYVRVAVGACLVIVVTFILRTDEYMGAGAELIEKAVENGQADTFAFFWKMVLTALTMQRRIPRGRDRTFFLHWSYLWLCDG